MIERFSAPLSNFRWRALDPQLRHGAVSYATYFTGLGVSKAIAGDETTEQVATQVNTALHTVNGAAPVSLLDLFPDLAAAGYLSISTDGSLFILGIAATQFLSLLVTVISIVFLCFRFIGDFALWWPSWKIKRADLEEMRALDAEVLRESQRKEQKENG